LLFLAPFFVSSWGCNQANPILLNPNPVFLRCNLFSFFAFLNKSTAILLTGMKVEWRLLEIWKNPMVLLAFNW
jgi:hypothetical protein